MVKRWDLNWSGQTYEIEHRNAHHIPHASSDTMNLTNKSLGGIELDPMALPSSLSSRVEDWDQRLSLRVVFHDFTSSPLLLRQAE